jgi:type IV pilus assembly protein PilW
MNLSARIAGRGFSMVELLVAMLIGLIGMVIIFQVFEVSEGIKRTTTSGGDAQQAGVIALYTMERDIKNAGMGFNDTTFVGCDIIGYDSRRATPDFPAAGVTMKLSPVLVIPGANSTVPDQLAVIYGSQPQAVASVPLAADMLDAVNAFNITNPFGYSPGDVIALVEPGTNKKCSIMEVTKITGNQIFHDSLGGYSAGGAARIARFNKAGGLGVIYDGFGTGNVTRVFNLGNLYNAAPGKTTPLYQPVYNVYSVSGGSLTVASQFVLDSTGQPLSQAISDNIVQMRVLYGLDDGAADNTAPNNKPLPAAADGVIDRYVDGAKFDTLPGTRWSALIAVKIALVARSVQPEKPSQGLTTCDATLVEPSWAATAWSVAPFNYNTRLDVSASADPDPASMNYWTCYRYRVFETTIPLRNWIWKAS